MTATNGGVVTPPNTALQALLTLYSCQSHTLLSYETFFLNISSFCCFQLLPFRPFSASHLSQASPTLLERWVMYCVCRSLCETCLLYAPFFMKELRLILLLVKLRRLLLIPAFFLYPTQRIQLDGWVRNTFLWCRWFVLTGRSTKESNYSIRPRVKEDVCR